MKTKLVAFVSGVIFAIGLGISGMTMPSKVLGFLDVAGAWDPSLVFVMIGAIAVHVLFARRALVMKAPLFAERFHWPEAKSIDARLVTGAGLFGLGWGIAGFCPGPALVAVVSLAPSVVVFVGAMIAGMLAFEVLGSRAAPQTISP